MLLFSADINSNIAELCQSCSSEKILPLSAALSPSQLQLQPGGGSALARVQRLFYFYNSGANLIVILCWGGTRAAGAAPGSKAGWPGLGAPGTPECPNPWELEWDDLRAPFQPKPSHGSIISLPRLKEHPDLDLPNIPSAKPSAWEGIIPSRPRAGADQGENPCLKMPWAKFYPWTN